MTKKELRDRARLYQITITHDAESGGWLVDIPTFPGIVTSGDTPEEALANAYEAIELVLSVRETDSRPLPAPDAKVAA